MKIETKYEINQPVWIIKYDKIVECFISTIEVVQYGKVHNRDGEIDTRYTLRSIDAKALNDHIETHKIYPTKQEAANAWLIAQGLTIVLKED